MYQMLKYQSTQKGVGTDGSYQNHQILFRQKNSPTFYILGSLCCSSGITKMKLSRLRYYTHGGGGGVEVVEGGGVIRICSLSTTQRPGVYNKGVFDAYD